MGIKTDIEKIKKFKEEYQFIFDNKDKVCKLTNGLVSENAINQMEHYIPALLTAAAENFAPDAENAYDKVWETMQKGFIECAYLHYSKQKHEDGKMLNKEEYFTQVVENIEKCPHEKIVQTKIWATIYERAITEKLHHNTQKMAEFSVQKAKIEDMHKRYKAAENAYSIEKGLSSIASTKRTFEPIYGDIDKKENVKKLDDEIKKIEDSPEYIEARKQQAILKKEADRLKVIRDEKEAEKSSAEAEKKKACDDAIRSGVEKVTGTLKIINTLKTSLNTMLQIRKV